MKKRVLSLALCLCLSAAAVTGCGGKKENEEKKEENAKEELISVEDDHADALHEVLMKKTGDYALKYGKVSDYSNLQLEVVKQTEITDELFQQQLDSLLSANVFTFEGQVASGETINVDYKGFMDGEQFQGGTGEAQNLTIGSGQFIDGFEEQLIGMNIGETKTIDVTFPEVYENNPDMAGKAAKFEVTANFRVESSGKAELTDQWVAAYLKKSGGVLTNATVDSFKDYYRKYMEDSAAEDHEQNVYYALVDKILEIVTVDKEKVPDAQMDYYRDMVQASVESNIKSQYGMTPEEYMKQTQMTQDDWDKEIEDIADERMRYEYALLLIGEKEKLMPTEEEYTSLLQEYADNNSQTLDEFRSTYQEQYQIDLYFEAYANKVLEKLQKDASVIDTEPVSSEAPAASGASASSEEPAAE